MDRFWSKIDRASPNECWPWTRSKSVGGYGHWSYWEDGKCRSTTAHRQAWTLINGPIPKGLQVLHKCDNPPCCNPNHLWLGTHADNMADKVAKGRQSRLGQPRKTHCKYGHKFTAETTMLVKVRGRQTRSCIICHRRRSLEGYHKRRSKNG